MMFINSGAVKEIIEGYAPKTAQSAANALPRRRLDEWHLGHIPFSLWDRNIVLEISEIPHVILEFILKTMRLFERGRRNALDVKVEERELEFVHLPKNFDGLRILFLADLHIDGMDELPDVLVSKLREVKADLCLLGGDYRSAVNGPIHPVITAMRKVVSAINAPLGIYGVLGNHDCVEMLPALEQMGVRMLMNDSVPIQKGNQRFYLTGVDDPHYFQGHDMEKAFQSVPKNKFILFLAHSPELYREAAGRGAGLYLCGHTHQGQIRIPLWGPLVTRCPVPRNLTGGFWKHLGMVGYTAAGVGTSGTHVRFLCQPEITILTLKSKGDI